MCGVQPRPVNTQPLQTSVQDRAATCPPEELAALRASVDRVSGQLEGLTRLMGGQSQFQACQHGALPVDRQPLAPSAGSLPPPSIDLASAPAGRGLTTNPTGWPQGSVQTAGGYTVVPEGKDNAWSIFGPNQGPQDKPISRVWGDPHVDEADGQRWDFTKSSNFRLPDGTLIDARTTSETGQSVTKGISIINGNDRVNIEGIDKNKPVTSAVTRDGFDYRAQLQSNNPGRDTFVLGGTNRSADGNDRVQWAKEQNGANLGVIGGTINNVDGKGSYGQRIDQNRQFVIDSSLRPDPFKQPEAWGNMLRGQVADAAGVLPDFLRDNVTAQLGLQDSIGRFVGDLRKQFETAFAGFGGLGNIFGQQPVDEGFRAASRMFGVLLGQQQLQNAFTSALSFQRGLYV